MENATMRRLVGEARVARLASIRPDGRPHIIPCCFAIEGDTLYSAVDTKPKSTLELRRLENVRSTPAVALLVDHYSEAWTALWWVRLDGTAQVIEAGHARDHALECLREKYEQYRRDPPPGPVIMMDVTRWRAWP